MTCDEVCSRIHRWDPQGVTQLSDDVALHLDACPACMAAFDARFVPVPEEPVPALRLQVPRRPVDLRLAVTVAAILVAFVLTRDHVVVHDEAVAALDHGASECLTDEPWDEGVCEV